MKKLFFMFLLLGLGFATTQAQTTKCDITSEACKKICETNPECCKILNCSPASSTALAVQTAQKNAAEPKAKACTAQAATCQKKKVTNCTANKQKAKLAAVE